MKSSVNGKTLEGVQPRKIMPIIDLKSMDSDNGGFSGYGSIFGNVDSYDDIVMAGAFTETLPDFLKNGFVSVGHMWSDLPVATFKDAAQDDKGLFVVAEFHSDEYSQRARLVTGERIARGKGVGLSIGFSIKKGGASWAMDEDGMHSGIRLLTNLDLFEVALVNMPANPQTWADDVKGMQMRSCSDPTCGCRISQPSHEGLKFADHGEALLTELRGFTQRAQALAAKRANQQRTPSEEHVDRVTALVTDLRACADTVEGLLSSKHVDTDGETRNDALHEIARFEILRAQALSVAGATA
jgi:HK97 family phage prohead protease